MEIGKLLMLVGAAVFLVGVLTIVAQRLGIGSLPGDFLVKRESLTVYFPLMSSLILSILVSLILWIVRRR